MKCHRYGFADSPAQQRAVARRRLELPCPADVRPAAGGADAGGPFDAADKEEHDVHRVWVWSGQAARRQRELENFHKGTCVAALTRDFRRTDPDEMELEPLRNRMRFLKNAKEGEVQVSDVVQQYARQQVEKHAEQLAQKHIINAARDFYLENNLDVETVALQKACEPKTRA